MGFHLVNMKAHVFIKSLSLRDIRFDIFDFSIWQKQVGRPHTL